jgi:multiple sugar transport system substrate-binding protein
MKRNVILTLISALVVAGLILSACAPSAEPTQAPAEEEAAPEGEAVTIRVWTHQNDAFNEGLENLAEAYMAENPNVTINFETFDYDTYIQTLQTALPAGTEADILQMFGSWVCSYVEGGYLAQVPEGVMTLEQAQADFFAAPVGGYTCDGALYGLPQEFNIEYGAALVNTQMAEEAGITDITDGWANWDEFIVDAQALTVTEDGVMLRAGYNFTGSDGLATSFHSLILQYGGEYLTADGYSVNTPEGQQTLELLQSFVDAGIVDPILFNDDENWVGDSYFDGTTAIGLVGPWVIPEYAGDYPEVVDVTEYVPLPSVGDEPLFAAASGWGLTVSANSAVQEAAWDFIAYVALDPENAVQWNLASGTLPALSANATGAGAEELVAAFPYFEPFLNILEYGRYEGAFPDRDFVWYEVAYPRVLNFLQGNATLEETLETIDQEVNDSFE